MENNIKKLELNKIIIVPKYKKSLDTIYITGGELALRIFYEYTNEWIAIYPSNESDVYYNLSNDFEKITKAKNQLSAPDYTFYMKKAIKLIDLLQASKFKYDIKKIKYNDLLYLIEPITRMQEYSYREEKKYYDNIQYDSNKLIKASLYVKGNKLDNQILEEHDYYLIDINKHIPVSYDFINNDIPYVLKEDFIKNKKDNNKSLVKRSFRKN